MRDTPEPAPWLPVRGPDFGIHSPFKSHHTICVSVSSTKDLRQLLAAEKRSPAPRSSLISYIESRIRVRTCEHRMKQRTILTIQIRDMQVDECDLVL